MTEDDFWLDAPRVAAELDDPTTDAAALSSFALGKGLKDGSKAVITAEGGDELFCGHNRYRRARWFGSFLERAGTRRQFESLHQTMGNPIGWREALNQLERYRAGLTKPLCKSCKRSNVKSGCPMIEY